MGRPRCECCDEVLEELLMMRQNFEKLFHRLSTQIVELRRELHDTIKDDKTPNSATSIAAFNERHIHRRKEASCSRSSAERDGSPQRKIRRHENNVTESGLWSALQCTDYEGSAGETEGLSLLTVNVKSEQTFHPNYDQETNARNVNHPMLEFFGIREHVIPIHPFKKTQDFEDWDAQLTANDDQKDQLRVELLQGHFADADKYLKHMWRSVMADEVAECYSYRGNTKTNKKAMRDFTFTRIFQDCFLQRYEYLRASYFMERTMRFLNYAHDRKRKYIRYTQSRQFESIQIDTSNMNDQQPVEESNFEEVLQE